VQNGDLTVLGNTLPASASDVDFQAWLKESDGDEELAMDSYRSSLEGGEELPRKTGKQSGSKKAPSEGS
jgi:hypothetical protein